MTHHKDVMDYLKKFEVELDKDVYYAGEVLTGRVIARITENIKVHGNGPSI